MKVKIKNKFEKDNNIINKINNKNKDFIFWGILVLIIIIVYILISSKEYSFLLVLSSLIQMFSFLIILLKIIQFKNCNGLSLNTLICYLLVLFGRLSSNLFYVTYLPNDDSGDWFYQLTEIISFTLIIYLIYLIKIKFNETSDLNLDNIKYYYFTIPCLIIAIFIHPTLNSNILTDTLWTFSMYLQTFSILPQIQLFINKKGKIENYTSHYIALCGLSTLFSLLYWFDCYNSLNSWNVVLFPLFSQSVGYFILFFQCLQLIIMCDFYYLYFKSLCKGKEIDTLNFNN